MSAPEGIKPEVWEAAGKLDTLPLNAGLWSMTIIDAYRQAWIREERDRIIELLENESKRKKELSEDFGCGSDARVTLLESEAIWDVIALIKGENE